MCVLSAVATVASGFRTRPSAYTVMTNICHTEPISDKFIIFIVNTIKKQYYNFEKRLSCQRVTSWHNVHSVFCEISVTVTVRQKLQPSHKFRPSSIDLWRWRYYFCGAVLCDFLFPPEIFSCNIKFFGKTSTTSLYHCTIVIYKQKTFV